MAAALDLRAAAMRIWAAGIAAVTGERAVARALERHPGFRASQVVAVGKAALAMCEGARAAIADDTAVLAVGKRGVQKKVHPPDWRVLYAAHPVPDESSVVAGRALLECVQGLPRGSRLLMLVSGGASALAEYPVAGVTLDDIRAETEAMLADGSAIAEINARRTQLSRIKGGKLLSHFRGGAVLSLAMSDVRGDDIEVIGSGIGSVRDVRAAADAEIVARNRDARDAAATEGVRMGLAVISNEESLFADVASACRRIVRTVRGGRPGVYVWGGEPTLRLPSRPGRGGRNTHLALAVARDIAGMDNVVLLVAGTDGDDGSAAAAGAIVDGRTVDDVPAAAAALAAADSASFLAARGALFQAGDTGSNVMDLAVAIVGAGR